MTVHQLLHLIIFLPPLVLFFCHLQQFCETGILKHGPVMRGWLPIWVMPLGRPWLCNVKVAVWQTSCYRSLLAQESMSAFVAVMHQFTPLVRRGNVVVSGGRIRPHKMFHQDSDLWVFQMSRYVMGYCASVVQQWHNTTQRKALRESVACELGT